MKKRNNEGSSLLEIVIAIAVLAAIVIPVCSSLVMSHKINAKTEKLLQAQLEVSSNVELLMSKGIPENYHDLIALLNVSETATKEEKNGAITALAQDGITEEALWWITLYAQHPEIVIEKREPLNAEDSDSIPNYYKVTVTSVTDSSVDVETIIRAVPAVVLQEPEQGGGA